MPTQTVGDSLG